MANAKNKRNKNRQRNRNRTRNRRRRNRNNFRLGPYTGGYNNRIHKDVCALLDPFCEHANGAKYNAPGFADAPSVAFQAKTIMTLSTGDTGYNVMFFNLNGFSTPFAANPVNTTLSVTVPANEAAFQAYAESFSCPLNDTADGVFSARARVVSAGLRVTDAAPMTGAGGFIKCYSLDNYGDWSGDSINVSSAVSYNSQRHFDRRVRGGVTLVPRRLGNNSEAIQDVSAWSGVTSGWESFCVIVSGTPSTVVCNVELVINYEVFPFRSGNTSISGASDHGRVSKTAVAIANEAFREPLSNIRHSDSFVSHVQQTATIAARSVASGAVAAGSSAVNSALQGVPFVGPYIADGVSGFTQSVGNSAVDMIFGY